MYINSIKHLNQIVPTDIINANQFCVQISGVTTILDKDILCDFFDHIYDVYLKYYDDLNRKKEVLFPLSSKILRKKYGNAYNKYMQYLIDNAYIRLILNEIEGERCRQYKLVDWKIERTGLIHHVNFNPRLITKQNKNTLKPEYGDSPYSKKLLGIIAKNLEVIRIQKEPAISYLKTLYPNPMDRKYLRNYNSILNIDDGNIYLTCDDYGRIHTNFTTLKREIRNQFLSIDNQPLKEVDIKNSQPLFFLYLLSKNLNNSIDKEELIQFKSDVIEGVIYDKLASFYGVTRKYMKGLFYKFLFGKSGSKCRAFTKYYPSITVFINQYKNDNNYEHLSHQLQKLEGEFIFKKICVELNQQKIKYFTVHDSVYVKESDYQYLKIIFDNHLDELKQNITDNLQSYYHI